MVVYALSKKGIRDKMKENNKAKNIIKKYIKSIGNDEVSAVLWCFIAIQRIIFHSNIRVPGIIHILDEDVLIKHILTHVYELTDVMKDEIEEMNND